MSPELAREVLGLLSNSETASLLTSDETRILEKLAEGHVYQTAAAELALPAREIGLRIKGVYDRVHLRSAKKPTIA